MQGTPLQTSVSGSFGFQDPEVIRVYANQAQKEKSLKVFPAAKFASATTKNIEPLPGEVKDKILDEVVVGAVGTRLVH